MNKLFPWLIFMLICSSYGEKTDDGNCKNLLFFFGASSKSQEITFMPLAKSLAENCHKVTVVMPARNTGGKVKKSGHPNIKLKIINFNFDDFQNHMSVSKIGDHQEQSFMVLIQSQIKVFQFFSSFVDLNIQAVKEILDSKEKFDVVIMNVFPTNEVAYYLAHRLGVPTIMYSSYQGSLWFMDQALGADYNPSLIPSLILPIKNPMGFPQRLLNFAVYCLLQTVRNHWYMNGPLERRIKAAFPDDTEDRPTILELEQRVNLGFQFSHPLIGDGYRPVAPNHINVGMMNCRPTGKVKDDTLLKFMESKAAKEHGVILVTFGSVIKASLMSAEKKAALLSNFGQLKQQVIWKWEEDLSEKPDNLYISDWLPQKEILNHENTVLHINHGGQSSVQECWCFQKPMLVVSVFGDQAVNGRQVEESGTGLHINFPDIDEHNVLKAINTILNDESFKAKAKKHGELLMDQAQHPLDRAVWWVEYILRHPDYRLETPYHELTWWQYQLLDVYAFLLASTLITTFISFKLLKCLCCRRLSRSIKSKSD